MLPTDPILSSVTAAAACSLALDRIQKTKLIPWINDHSTTINTIAKLVMSGLSTIGIAHAWTPATGGGGTLMLTIPSLSVIAIGVWHWFGQFAIQHTFGKVLFTPVPQGQPNAPAAS